MILRPACGRCGHYLPSPKQRTTGETIPERQGMLAILTSLGIRRALCLALMLALALGPAVEASHHGPGPLAAEVDHHDHAADSRHHHPEAHHDASDHDHVSVALLGHEDAGVHPKPGRLEFVGAVVADSSPPDGPRRPPRPMMT